MADYQKLVSYLQALDPRTPLMASIEELLKKEKELSTKQEEINAITGFRAGGKKKKAEEEFSEIKKSLESLENKLIKSIFDSYNKLYNEMMDNIRTIAIVAPDKMQAIKSIMAPMGSSDRSKIMAFSQNVISSYNDLMNALKKETADVLNVNKELLEKYKAYVEIPREEVASTSRTTHEALDLMNLTQLLNEKDILGKENGFLEKRREDVERKLRIQLNETITILIKNTETATSLGIEIPKSFGERNIQYKQRMEQVDQLQNLFDINNEVQKAQAELLNTLRSEITKLRTDTQNQIGRLAIVSKETKNFPEIPELNLSSSNMIELIQQLETLRNYVKRILIEMKKLVDISEFNAAIRALDNKQIPVPRELKEDVINIHKQLENAEELAECTNLLIAYYNTSSQLTEVIRQKLYEMVENEELKSVSEMFPPPPKINIETINPKLLLRQFDEIEKWQKTISTYLQGMANEISQIIDQLNRAERVVPIKPEFKKDLSSLMNKVVGERDISTLVRYRKDLETIQESIFAYLFNIVNEDLQGPLVTKISLIQGAPDPATTDLKGKTSIPNLITKIEEINEWKKRVLVFLKDTRQLDQVRIMADTAQLFEVILPPDYLKRVAGAKEKVQSLNQLDELLESYSEREALIEELNALIRKRIKSLVDLMNTLGMDLISEIGITMEGEFKVLKESLEKIYKWMDNKRTELQKRIDRSRTLLRAFQSKSEAGQLPIEVPTELLTLVNENAKIVPAKNDVKDLATDLQKLSDTTIKVTDYVDEKARKELRELREQIQLAKQLRSTANIPDLNIPDFSPGNIEGALNSLTSLEDWKTKAVTSFVDGLKNMKFPSIPTTTEFDLSQQRQVIIEDLQRLPPSKGIHAYNTFLQELENMRSKIITVNSELRDKIQSITARSESLFDQKIDDYSDSRGSRATIESSYGEVLQEWWNLNSHLQWQKEVLLTYIHNDIGYKLSVLQELAPPNNEFFQNTISFLYEKSQGAKEKGVEGIIQDYRIVQEKIIEYIEEDYRKFLQGGILPSIRVALPRIREIIQLPPRIIEIEQNIERAITSQRDFFVIVGSASQLMGFYTEIVNELKVIAKEQSSLMLKEIQKLADNGLDLQKYVLPEIKMFALMDETGNIKFENEEHRATTIKDTTDCFVAIDQLRSNKEVCRSIRSESVRYVNEVRKAIQTVSQLYKFNVEERFPVIQEYISEEFEHDIARDNIFTLADLYVSLVQFRNDFIIAMRGLEDDQHKKFEKELTEKYRYYSVIHEIFEDSPVEMEEVFPLTKMNAMTKEAMTTQELGILTDILPQLQNQREEFEKQITQLNNWHRGLRMFITYYSKIDSVHSDLSDEENIKQFEDIKKRIYNTYKQNKKIRTYFTCAVKKFIELKTQRPLKVQIQEKPELAQQVTEKS